MNVFDLRDRLVNEYASYTRSFIKITDPRISNTVESSLNAGAFWPEPLLQLNPTFLPGGTIDELVADRSAASKLRTGPRLPARVHGLAFAEPIALPQQVDQETIRQ
jgi:hypothetical protein